MTVYERELKNYKKLNSIARQDSVVMFGSTFAKDMPLGELKQNFEFDVNLYNRSFSDLSIFDAAELAKEVIKPINPSKVLIQLGETDLERGYKTIDEMCEAMEKLIAEIKSWDKHMEVVLVSIVDEEGILHPEELNRRIEKIAKANKCKYADITAARTNEFPDAKAFSLLRSFMKNGMSFADAFAYV